VINGVPSLGWADFIMPYFRWELRPAYIYIFNESMRKTKNSSKNSRTKGEVPDALCKMEVSVNECA
jgi:hypothetical protein